MNVALLIGRGGSTGFPGKNLFKLLGRPLMDYPILAAKNSRIDRIYLSTDDQAIAANGAAQGCELIERPPELATKEALSENAFRHGYREISRRLGAEPENVVLLFCNGATIRPGIIDEGIDFLKVNPEFDSAVSVSCYNMFSPLRARVIADGEVRPFIPPSFFANANCDRDSQGDSWFVDCSAFVVRPRCFDYERNGDAPFRWIGRKVHPLKQWGGLDIDMAWQVGQVEYWLGAHGFSQARTPYDRESAPQGALSR
ncbi:MAG: cytidylyltransferase [Elusimicrobia bacterium]|nr:cytidylyltransferase [Elusimicrobiota bacterium]